MVIKEEHINYYGKYVIILNISFFNNKMDFLSNIMCVFFYFYYLTIIYTFNIGYQHNMRLCVHSYKIYKKNLYNTYNIC